MNLGCCLIFFVLYFVGFEKIEATISSQHANDAVQAWRQKNSIQPDMLPDYAVFMGASELDELRKHEQFKKPTKVLDQEWKDEMAKRQEKDPKYKPTIEKGVEDIEEGDFTYVDGGEKYHVIWGKSFVTEGELKTGEPDKVKVGEEKTVEVDGKEVKKGGATVTLTVENLLTPKMVVDKGINAITSRWVAKGISAVEHNKFVEMRVGVFMLKCINTHKWDPTRSVVVLKLRYKSESKDTDYFLNQIKAYRDRTYLREKSEQPSVKFDDKLEYNPNVSQQAAEDAEKWKYFLDTIPKVDQQATKDTQQNARPTAKSNKPMQQTPPTPSKTPSPPTTQQTNSNTTKALNFDEIKNYFEGYAKATAEAAKQKRIDDQNAKAKDAEAAARFTNILNEWNERVKTADLQILQTVHQIRMQKLEAAKERAKTIGYADRKNMYRIELNIPKPSAPLGSIFTEEEYVIHKILEQKNEFPYFLYKHATDLGYGYRETADKKYFSTIVLIQVGDTTETESKLNETIHDVMVANIRKAMDASARLFNEETDTLPPALYELIYGIPNEELSKIQDTVRKAAEGQGLTEEQIQAKIRADLQHYGTNAAHPEEGDTSHNAPAPAEKKEVQPGSLKPEVIAGIATPPALKKVDK